MQTFVSRLLAAIVLCALSAGYAPAQQNEPIDKPEETTPAQEFPRREPSFWHRPAKDTAADQLAYAKSLAEQGKLRKAMRQYRALVHKWHDAPEAVKAQTAYAELFMQKGKYRRAFDEYQYLAVHYPQDASFDGILQSQFQIAQHIMNTRVAAIPLLRFGGFEASERALPLLEKIVANAPNWQFSPQAQFLIGTIYEKQKDYDKACPAFQLVESRYPNSEFVVDAAFRRAYCLYTKATRRNRDENLCREALSSLAAFLRDHPDTGHTDAAKACLTELKTTLADMYYRRALYYDKDARKPKAALIAYTDYVTKFPEADNVPTATERIETLKVQLGEKP